VRTHSGAGILNPFYDEDTDVLCLASKGENSVHIYDMSSVSSPTAKPKECSKAAVPGGPTTGMCLLPKVSCDVKATEVARGLQATATKIQPITFTVPRAAKLAEYFQDDLYPKTRDLNNVKMDPETFFNGSEPMPEVVTVSLRPSGMALLSEKPEEKRTSSRPKASTYLTAQREEEERKKAKEEQFKRLEALAHQHAKYNANKSMGSRKIKGERERVAARDADDDDSSDSGWSDDD
jgi:coronin-2